MKAKILCASSIIFVVGALSSLSLQAQPQPQQYGNGTDAMSSQNPDQGYVDVGPPSPDVNDSNMVPAYDMLPPDSDMAKDGRINPPAPNDMQSTGTSDVDPGAAQQRRPGGMPPPPPPGQTNMPEPQMHPQGGPSNDGTQYPNGQMYNGSMQKR